MTAVPSPVALGETDLDRLLSGLDPQLHAQPLRFVRLADGQTPPSQPAPVMLFREDEGVTCLLADAPGDENPDSDVPRWAQITLRVHSSLSAVGLIAAVSAAFAREGIACNPVSAFHHDHLFVPWPRRHDALAALAQLQANQTTC
jgi:hypothetical protein